MLLQKKPRGERSGLMVLESAMIMPVFLLMLIGFIIAALGVFRFQEVSSLAREGARYASVHGYQYAQANFTTAATPEEVYDKAIRPRVVALNASAVTYDVSWSPDNKQGSVVTVTVSYKWVPEAFLGGITLTSTSSTLMAY